MVEPQEVQALEALVAKLKEDPSLIYDPKLAFFKDFVLSWGAKVPEDKPKAQAKAPEPEPAKVAEEEEEEEEPDEPDPERLEEDPEPYPSQGPGEVELSDEQLDKQGELKQAAAEALDHGDTAKALQKLTEAFAVGNVTAMMFAKRGELLLKLKRPKACIADCDAALKINPDSGKAYRVRGKAHRLLGHWEEAHKDLAESQKLDFDDETAELQKFVDSKYKKIAERKNKDRIKAEKKAAEERKRRREEAQRAYEEAKKAPPGGYGGGFPGFPGMGGMGGMPGMGGMGGMPGMPGMPGGIDPSMLSGIMSDPELMQAFSDPKMAQAMQDIMSNPANIGKYQNDPDVMNLINKVMGAFSKHGGMPGGMAGMPGGMPGGMGGTPGSGSDGPTVEEVPEATNVDEVD